LQGGILFLCDQTIVEQDIQQTFVLGRQMFSGPGLFRSEFGLDGFGLFDGIIGSEIMLRLDNNETIDNKVAEIRLLVPGYDLFAKKQCKSFEEATDSAVEALRKQLIKHKEKMRKKN